MKERTKGFLAKYFEEPQPDQELSNYIQELHEYLWRFVRAEFPWANGNLSDYVKLAAESAEHHKEQRTDIVEYLDKRQSRQLMLTRARRIY